MTSARARRLVAAAAVVGLVGCHKPSPDWGSSSTVAARAPTEAEAPVPPTTPSLIAARCERGSPALEAVLAGADASPGDIELGEGVMHATDFAIGLLHRVAAGSADAVALVGTEAPYRTRVVDLGLAPGDASPPRVAQGAAGLLAAGVVLADSSDCGERPRLVVWTIGPTGDVSVRARVARVPDDSLAFDLAVSPDGAVVAWDDAERGPRGVVRAAGVGAGASGTTRDLSPPDSDAELPRLVATSAGFLAFWIAHPMGGRRALGADGGAPSEVSGEAPVNAWIEAVPTDREGAVAGGVRRLTSTNGRVSAFDVAPLREGGDILVVARDDGERIDGSGGAILSIRMEGDHVDSPVVLPTGILGRGAPALIDGPLPWLSWIGPHEGLRLAPLDSPRLALRSAERRRRDERGAPHLRPAARGRGAGHGGRRP